VYGAIERAHLLLIQKQAVVIGVACGLQAVSFDSVRNEDEVLVGALTLTLCILQSLQYRLHAVPPEISHHLEKLLVAVRSQPVLHPGHTPEVLLKLLTKVLPALEAERGVESVVRLVVQWIQVEKVTTASQSKSSNVWI
jgi:hypothetical protein